MDHHVSHEWKDSNTEPSRSMSVNIALHVYGFSDQFSNEKLHGATKTQAHQVLKGLQQFQDQLWFWCMLDLNTVFCISDTDVYVTS